MNPYLYKSLLYDYYGPLLTEKQRQVFEMYYSHDMSLSEISENTGVSPQGISDMIKRSEKALQKYEEKLNLVAGRSHIRQALEEVDKLLGLMGGNEECYKERIKGILADIMSLV